MINKDELNHLISELSKGNLDVFDEFYDKTKNQLYYHIIHIIKDRQLAEDILQEVYLKILNSLNSFKPGTNPLAWMITIARNTSINLYNKRKREIYYDAYENPNLYGSVENPASQDTPLIDMMYQVLNEKERELVILYVINGLTHKEIANMLNRPLGTVLWQYNQAIKKLKEKVGERDEISK